MNLIDKDTLVAEIKNRRDGFYSLSKLCEKGTPARAGFYAQAQTLEGILSFLDTLEVKEMDLEEEVVNWWNEHYAHIKKGYTFEGYTGHYMENSTVISLAKHFYELGLKAQKGE